MVHQSPPETTTIPSVCVINKDSSKGWVVLTRHLCSFELYEGVESHKVKAFTRQKQQKVVRNPRGSTPRIHFKGTNAGHKVQVTDFFFLSSHQQVKPYHIWKKKGVQVCKSQKQSILWSSMLNCDLRLLSNHIPPQEKRTRSTIREGRRVLYCMLNWWVKSSSNTDLG